MDALLIILLVIIIALAICLHQKCTNPICLSRKRLDGKTVIVTGGTAGMGFEIAKDLAHRGARVIIACPFHDEGTQARQAIVEETENENVIFKLLDLAKLKSIRKFAANILKEEDRLDILINNAGVVSPKDFITADGMSFTMQVNYYGTFLLTLLLLPLLRKTGTSLEKSKIITTSSVTHFVASLDIDNYNKPNYWFRTRIYPNSKMCLVMFVRELAKKLVNQNVVVNNVDPGATGTRLHYAINKFWGLFITILFNVFFKTTWEGCQTALHVALDKKAGEVSGEVFKNCAIRSFVRKSNEDVSKRLWKQSVKLVKLSDEELKEYLKV